MNVRSIVLTFLACGLHSAFSIDPPAIPGLSEPAAAERISIPELLDPATRLRAFEQFCEPPASGQPGAPSPENAARFKTEHDNLTVIERPKANPALHYLVTWNYAKPRDSWDEMDAATSDQMSSASSLVLYPHPESYQFFSKDGIPFEKQRSGVADGLIADLKGDGDPEMIETMSPSRIGSPAEPSKGIDYVAQYLEVHRVDHHSWEAESSLAILYNTHPGDMAAGNTWGYQVRKMGDHEPCQIELGPTLAAGGIEPKVVFHWHREQQQWIGPPAQAGDHFRLLQSKNPGQESERIANSGGLGYPLIPLPAKGSPATDITMAFPNYEELPPERLSHPFHYHSLSKLSDQEILAYMARGPSAKDYALRRLDDATSVPDLWNLDPQSAALKFVEQNRPPSLRPHTEMFVHNPGGKPAPDEGSFVFGQGSGGLAIEPGETTHYLRCAREGSFLAYASVLPSGSNYLPPSTGNIYDFRKLDLSYDEARKLFQFIWWLTHIRTRMVGDVAETDYMFSVSDAECSATLQMLSPDGDFSVDGETIGMRVDRYDGLSPYDVGYDPSACLTLVGRLFRKEVPELLAGRWVDPDSSIGGMGQQAPEDFAHLRQTIVTCLSLLHGPKLPFDFAAALCRAAGELGINEARPDIEALPPLLPPPSSIETGIARLEAKIEVWTKKLGTQAEYAGFCDRENRRNRAGKPQSAALSPGVGSMPVDPVAPAAPRPVTPKEEATFHECDALYRQLAAYWEKRGSRDATISALRMQIPTVLQQLDHYNDAAYLLDWARRDDTAVGFAFSRLLQLDLPRAAQLLSTLQKKASGIWEHDRFASRESEFQYVRDASSEPAPARRLTKTQIARQLAILRQPQAAPTALQRALAALIPEEEPERYPDKRIDAALLELLNRPKNCPDTAYGLAAFRLGNKAWEPILAPVRTDRLGAANEPVRLAALTLIGRQGSKEMRRTMSGLLAPELQETCGNIDDILWSIWALDLRDLQPQVERIATGTPEDFEGMPGWARSSEKRPILHRYHLARQIAALWNEEDALTRGRLLIAFAAAHSYDFAVNNDDIRIQLHDELQAILASLDPAQRATLAAFAAWIEANTSAQLREAFEGQSFSFMMKAIRGMVAAPPTVISKPSTTPSSVEGR